MRNIDPSDSEVAITWLSRARWGTIGVQAFVYTFAYSYYGLGIPAKEVAVVLGFLSLTNILLIAARGNSGELSRTLHACGAILLMDVFAVAYLLYMTSGLSNPLCSIYPVYATIAALIIGPQWTFLITAASVSCLLWLLENHRHIPGLHTHGPSDNLNIHLVGQSIAFAVVSIMTAIFVVHIRRALKERDAQLENERARNVMQKRLSALTTLAAGAAHEIATPLATITLIAEELEKKFSKQTVEPAILEDLKLVQSEVGRCRAILDGMKGAASEGRSTAAPQTLDQIAKSLRLSFGVRRVVTRVAPSQQKLKIDIPGILRTISSLVKNALEASADDQTVDVSFEVQRGMFEVTVRDLGTGMSRETMEHLGEPFFTTKSPGSGMGLGVFLVRVYAEQAGGTLRFESVPGEGTVATLRLPLQEENMVIDRAGNV